MIFDFVSLGTVQVIINALFVGFGSALGSYFASKATKHVRFKRLRKLLRRWFD